MSRARPLLRTRTAWPLAALTAAVLLGGACNRRPDDDARVFDLERMVVQPRLDPYEAAPFFPEGRAMRVPPAGAVPYGPPLAADVATGLSPTGAYLETIPERLDAEAMARGRRSFEIYCAPCHGASGEADTPVARRMRLRPPPSLHEARLRALPVGRLFRVVRQGYGLMPSYAPMLSVGSSWEVAAYVRALQRSRHARLDELPPELRADARAHLDAEPSP